MREPFIEINKLHNSKPMYSLFHPHTHNIYEIFCFLNGDAKYYIEGNIYSLFSGDIFIMKKGETHSLLINQSLPYDRIVLNFNSDAVLKNYAPKILSFLDNKPLGKNNRYAATIFQNNNWLYYLEKMIDTTDIAKKDYILPFFWMSYQTIMVVSLMTNHL